MPFYSAQKIYLSKLSKFELYLTESSYGAMSETFQKEYIYYDNILAFLPDRRFRHGMKA